MSSIRSVCRQTSADFFEVCEVFLNRVEIGRTGRKKEQFVSAFLNELPGFLSFVKGGIVHDEQGARLKLLEQLFLEVVIEYEGIEVPLKSSGAKSLFPLAVAAMRLVLGRLLPLRSPKTLRPLRAHAQGRWAARSNPVSSR